MDSTIVQRGLIQQGYDGCSVKELNALAWGLRFTPTVCMVGALIGLATQTPWIHFTLGGLGIFALIAPAHHPFDLLYNHVVRRAFGAPKLPPNPLQRRIACFLGGCMNLGIALSFVGGLPLLAYALGAMLIGLQLVVISSHFCVASWMYELGATLVGHRKSRISGSQARTLVDGGAILVDVRTPDEYARAHLPGARNVPGNDIAALVASLKDVGKPLVLYCRSGQRSNRAREALQAAGVSDLHDLGSMRRW